MLEKRKLRYFFEKQKCKKHRFNTTYVVGSIRRVIFVQL